MAIVDRAFPVAAARAWNSLPQRVWAALSIVSFRRELKTYLFKNHFLSFNTTWWHCKVVLQQQCDSATLIKFTFNNNNNNRSTNQWNSVRGRPNFVFFLFFGARKCIFYFSAEKEIGIFVPFFRYQNGRKKQKKKVSTLAEPMHGGQNSESPAVAYSRCLHRHTQRQ